ncbi:MAG: hypothetical protein GY851_36095 [bacterium]|nr:hypothetical protein [bacterium]
MPKKETIEIHRDESLTGIDDEFDRALDRLSGAERNVRDLLESIEEQEAPQDEENGVGSEAAASPEGGDAQTSDSESGDAVPATASEQEAQ